MQCLDAQLLPRASRDVIYRSLPDGGVLFSMRDEVYYGLNTVGAFVWEALPPVTSTLDALCARLHARYADADLEAMRADVVLLLTDLLSYGLIAYDTALELGRME